MRQNISSQIQIYNAKVYFKLQNAYLWRGAKSFGTLKLLAPMPLSSITIEVLII